MLFNGRDFTFFDFEGQRVRRFSEMRLKRSPLRDLAALVCSLYYAGLVALRNHAGPGSPAYADLLPWAEAWFEIVSAGLVNRYKICIEPAGVLPADGDWLLMLDIYRLDRHLVELDGELRRQRGWAEIPVRGLLQELNRFEVGSRPDFNRREVGN